jgi:hypothetical protein
VLLERVPLLAHRISIIFVVHGPLLTDLTAHPLRRLDHDIRCRAAKYTRNGPLYCGNDNVFGKHIPTCARCQEVQVSGSCYTYWRTLPHRRLGYARGEGKDGNTKAQVGMMNKEGGLRDWSVYSERTHLCLAYHEMHEPIAYGHDE